MRTITALALVAGVMATPAAARDYYYFNKPGVLREVYVSEVSECSELAGGISYRGGGTIFVTYRNTSAGGAGAGLGLILGGILLRSEARRQQRSFKEVVERTCMADKGYRRMQVNKEFIRSIKNLSEEQARIERFYEFASSKDAVGKEMGE